MHAFTPSAGQLGSKHLLSTFCGSNAVPAKYYACNINTVAPGSPPLHAHPPLQFDFATLTIRRRGHSPAPRAGVGYVTDCGQWAIWNHEASSPESTVTLALGRGKPEAPKFAWGGKNQDEETERLRCQSPCFINEVTLICKTLILWLSWKLGRYTLELLINNINRRTSVY